MAKHPKLILAIGLIALMALVSACDYGQVDQGRVVSFNKEKGTVTIVRDPGGDLQGIDNSVRTVIYTMPKDPRDVGPEPKVGLRMKLDTKKNQISVYDPGPGKLDTATYTLLNQKDNLAADDPLVFDSSLKKAKKFPVVNKDEKTITIYSSRQKSLVTFSLPEKYFNLPEYTWESGDEVRIYYKEEGKALRFMNVTKTDIYKK